MGLERRGGVYGGHVGKVEEVRSTKPPPSTLRDGFHLLRLGSPSRLVCVSSVTHQTRRPPGPRFRVRR